ncbi:MAG: biopolymer transporter ExbD, partial [Alphaproteobacteria bacterium]|nr:biopolymer transporter ExbD [Alphaproteobacteria bacterium]
DDEPLTVTIRRDGAVYIQETPVELAMLGPKLEAITKQKMDTKIYVRGDKSVEYGKVMQVMGEINAAGFGKVAFLTENSGGRRK